MSTPVNRLGYFGPFMLAWGKAAPAVRAQVYAETIDYRAGLIDARTEVVEVSQTLGIPFPPAA